MATYKPAAAMNQSSIPPDRRMDTETTPATLTAEAGLPTRASAFVTVSIVPGIAKLNAMANPKKSNSPRRETNSDFHLFSHDDLPVVATLVNRHVAN